MIEKLLQFVLVGIINSNLFRIILFRAAIADDNIARKFQNIKQLKFWACALSKQLEFNSQLHQDTFIICRTNSKIGGYFVEVGAWDPIKFSNTFKLERDFGWSGLLIEPNPKMANRIKRKRSSKVIEVAISNRAGSVNLFFSKRSEFNTTSDVLIKDRHKLFKYRNKFKTIPSKKLQEVFKENQVPKNFDVLSIDIEGSELQALKSNDFNIWRPTYILIEHNFRKDRDQIRNFLYKKGYKLADENSRYSWDDWFELKTDRNI